MRAPGRRPTHGGRAAAGGGHAQIAQTSPTRSVAYRLEPFGGEYPTHGSLVVIGGADPSMRKPFPPEHDDEGL
jgi:hypothetical protein